MIGDSMRPETLFGIFEKYRFEMEVRSESRFDACECFDWANNKFLSFQVFFIRDNIDL